MDDDLDETPDLNADEEALLEEMPALTGGIGGGQTRRAFLGQAILNPKASHS